MSSMPNQSSRRTRRVFSQEFRAGAVRLVLDEGKTASAVARDRQLSVKVRASFDTSRTPSTLAASGSCA